MEVWRKDYAMTQSVLEMAKDLVMAQITASQLSPENVQDALQQTYASLMMLKVQEERGVTSPGAMLPTPPDWRKSLTRHTITCLECGKMFKQLSVRHLREHGLDGRSYRA